MTMHLQQPGRMDEPLEAQEYADVLSQVAADHQAVILRRGGDDVEKTKPFLPRGCSSPFALRLTPAGVAAISRGLSSDTPGYEAVKMHRPWQGSQPMAPAGRIR